MMMRAVVISAHGPASNLEVQQRPVPSPGKGEVLIEVHAAGINRPDVWQRKGNYPAPPGVVADIPGLEVAGTVVACGPDVDHWAPGTRVCALVAGGGYAEYVVADARHCLPVPKGVNTLHAACLPETVFTVWHNLFRLGGLKAGETVLVHGGSGGVGSTAIQVASNMGIEVYTTAGSDEKCAFCERLGAIRCINYHEKDFGAELPPRSVDVVLDSIGAPYFERNMALLADGGRMVVINAVGGRHVKVDLLALMQRRIILTGSTLRNQSHAFKSELRDAVATNVWPLVATNKVYPFIQEVFTLDDACRAHERMESGDFMGKLVLSV